jgi:hypothetical protein
VGNRAKVLAIGAGVIGGLVGMVHGYFETQQGGPPGGITINAIGPSGCTGFYQSTLNCLPAMTLLPDLYYGGIITIIIGLIIIGWTATRIRTRRGPIVLALLSLILLIVGGGFLPPLLGFIAAGAGTRAKAMGV